MISNIQLKQKTDEIKKNLLTLGIEPNNFEVNQRLHEFFDQKILGMPYYSPIKQKKYEVSSSVNYDHNFRTLQDDLIIAYAADIEMNNKVTSMQEYYDTEETNVRNELKKLAIKVDNVSEIIQDGTTGIEQYIETFGNYYGIDFYGDSSRNIPYTTCFVDLLQRTAYTEREIDYNEKVSLKNGKINISGTDLFINQKTQGEKTFIINDTSEKMYLFSGESTTQSPMTIDIVVDIGSIVDINSVTFEFISIKEMECVLSVSDDGSNFIVVYKNSSRDYIQWNFNQKMARYIKISCTKKEPDGMNDNVFQYHYLLKNISILNESFNQKSVFVSKRIEFENFKNTIRLDAADMVFNNTNINYFIGFDNGKDKVGWDAIKNHQDMDLYMFEKKTKIVNATTTEFGNESGSLYKLFKIPEAVNKNTVKVIPGYNMWLVERYDNKQPITSNLNLMNFDLTEYRKNCDITTLFMDCENYDQFTIDSDKLYVFTQLIKLDQSVDVKNVVFNVSSDSAFQMRLFVNGYEVSKVNDSYSFLVKGGVSKIQFILYSIKGGTLIHNLNMKQFTNNVFAMSRMRFLNDGALTRSIDNPLKYYTIKNGFVCVKIDPQDLIKSKIEDMGFLVSYSAIKDKFKNYFKENKMGFRIMAVLNSNDINLSPKILNFKVSGK